MEESFQLLLKELKTFFLPEAIIVAEDTQFIRFRLVVTTAKLPVLKTILEKYFKTPFKAENQRAGRDIQQLELVQALNGIRQEQSLYLNSADTAFVYFAAIWPWQSDPSQATLMAGLFFGGLQTEEKKNLITQKKLEIENILKE